jgi:ribosomal protein L11 methylase PrmA
LAASPWLAQLFLFIGRRLSRSSNLHPARRSSLTHQRCREDKQLTSPIRLPGSFRDPAGHVYAAGERILRTIAPAAASQYEACKDVLADLVSEGRLVAFTEFEPHEFGLAPDSASYVLEHPRLSPWTQPYEWSFSLLKEAALFHLDLHLDLLERGFTLSDSSAYNVQFVGPSPIFIDHLSIRPYVDGEFWAGHKQFCEQFLNPLLLRAYFDIAPNSWYRGGLEGIPTDAMAKLLPLRRRLSWNVLTNVILPAHFQKGTTSERDAKFSLKDRRLPLVGLQGMLRQLRKWIARLVPANSSATTWANYATTTTYDDEETAHKKRFVAEFIAETGARSVIDLGCNTGDYSKISLESGASSVTGFDFDQQSIDRAYQRAKAEKLNFLPLYLDARSPSPTQGWMQSERLGFAERFHADAVLALAFEHHLAIAHNVPLEQIVQWITAMAPSGVIEFVPKSDPTIVKMLALRKDIFPDYTLEEFLSHLGAKRTVVKQETVSKSGRTMVWFEGSR